VRTHRWQSSPSGLYGVGEQAFGKLVVVLVVEPTGNGAAHAVGEADIDCSEQPASVLPHIRREAGGDALVGDGVVGGANGLLVLLLAWLAYQNRKNAAVDVDERVGVAG
jgi:hypothetical protein